MFPNWKFDILTYDMVNPSWCSDRNLDWNLANTQIGAKWMTYINPSDSVFYSPYPNMNTWSLGFPDPRATIFEFKKMMNSGDSFNGGVGMFNWNPGNAWNNGNNSGNWLDGLWNRNNNNGNNGGATAGDAQYDELSKLLTKYRDLHESSTDSTISNEVKVIKEALNKQGTIEEKKTALKEAYAKLNSSRLQEAMLSLDENKNALYLAGYKFDKNQNDEDKELKKTLNSIEQDLQKTPAKYDYFSQIINSQNEEDILRIISYWNDTRNTNGNRSIIRLIAKNPNNVVGEKSPQKTTVDNLVMSLSSKVVDFEATCNSDLTKLKAADKEMKEALTVVQGENGFTENNLNKLADKFEKLYAMLRLLEAEKIKNNIKEKYGFLNGISSDDTDFINDNFIVKATKDDLAAEGIDCSGITIDEIGSKNVKNGDDGIEDNAHALVTDFLNKKLIYPVEVNNLPEGTVIYATAKNSEGKRQYIVVRDNKLMKINGVVNKGGTVTINGVNKLYSELTDADFTEVKSDSDLQNINVKKGDENKEANNTTNGNVSENTESNDKYTKQVNTYAASLNKLIGHTSVAVGLEVISTINNKLNSANIYDVLVAYNTNHSNRLGLGGNGGLCDQIDNEGDFSFLDSAFCDDTVKAEAIGKIVECVLEWAGGLDHLNTTSYYKSLSELNNKGNEELRANSEIVDQYIGYLVTIHKNSKED